MRIEDTNLINTFRRWPYCEVCKNGWLTEVHHILARGMGDAFRMDIPENLIVLCRECHTKAHNHPAMREVCLGIVCIRENIGYPSELLHFLQRIRYAPSIASDRDRQAYLDDQRKELLHAALPNQTGESLEAPEGDGAIRFS